MAGKVIIHERYTQDQTNVDVVNKTSCCGGSEKQAALLISRLISCAPANYSTSCPALRRSGTDLYGGAGGLGDTLNERARWVAYARDGRRSLEAGATAATPFFLNNIFY